jgi:hypothetical protein
MTPMIKENLKPRIAVATAMTAPVIALTITCPEM